MLYHMVLTVKDSNTRNMCVSENVCDVKTPFQLCAFANPECKKKYFTD